MLRKITRSFHGTGKAHKGLGFRSPGTLELIADDLSLGNAAFPGGNFQPLRQIWRKADCYCMSHTAKAYYTCMMFSTPAKALDSI